MENGAIVLCVRLSPVQFDSETNIGEVSQCNRFTYWENITVALFLGHYELIACFT